MANGLLNQKPAMPAGNPAEQVVGMAGEAPPADDAAEQQGEAASPEEQAQYELLVGQCLKVIYPQGQVAPGVLDRLKSGKPIDALAGAAVNIVSMVVKEGAANGHQFTTDVIFHGGKEIIQDLAELSSKAKIHDYTQDELDGAFYAAVDLYRADHSDQIDQNAAKAELQQLQQADQSGQLGKVVPGIDKAKAPMPGQQEAA